MRFRWRRLTYFSTKFLGGRLPSWCTLGKKIVLGGGCLCMQNSALGTFKASS
jgi:hypothetical protein